MRDLGWPWAVAVVAGACLVWGPRLPGSGDVLAYWVGIVLGLGLIGRFLVRATGRLRKAGRRRPKQ